MAAAVNPSIAMLRVIDAELGAAASAAYDRIVATTLAGARRGPASIRSSAAARGLSTGLRQVLRGNLEPVTTVLEEATLDVLSGGLNQQAREYRRLGVNVSRGVLDQIIDEAEADTDFDVVLRESLSSMMLEIDARCLTMLTNLDPGTTRANYTAMLAAELEANRWRMDRIVRTVGNQAYNAAAQLLAERLGTRVPKLFLRWTERVDDATGLPMDKRVGVDSLIMHGQVIKPGDAFKMPSTPRTPGYLAGKSWTAPPNRPNDRAVLVPFIPRVSTVPAWRLQGGRRIAVR